MIEFQVIMSYDETRFQKRVNEALKDGWEFHGQMIVTESNHQYSSIRYIQALIRPIESNKEDKSTSDNISVPSGGGYVRRDSER